MADPDEETGVKMEDLAHLPVRLPRNNQALLVNHTVW